MMDIYSDIGQKIKELRKTKHWNQTTLGEKLSIDRKTVGRIEQGEATSITVPVLIKASEVFECDIAYFFDKLKDCKTYDCQFIHDQIGLTEQSIDNLKKLNSYREGKKRIDLLNWLLNDPRFIYQLLDQIIKYCDKLLDFVQGRKVYRNELFLSSKLSKGDILKEIQLLEDGTIPSTITNAELNRLADLKDVSYLQSQRAFDNVLDCLVFHHCKKNGCDIDGTY